MARHVRRRRNGDNASRDYEVGYGKPPRRTQFKPGKSGNPKGRPKNQRDLAVLFDEVLDQTVTINDGARTRKVSKRKAFAETIVNGALRRDPKAVQALLAFMRATGRISAAQPGATPSEEVSPEDEAIIADFFRRYGGKS